MYDRKVACTVCPDVGDIQKGGNELTMELCTDGLVRGSYRGELILFNANEFGTVEQYDIVLEAFYFEKTMKQDFEWNALKWSSVRLNNSPKLSGE